jgi:hypothetical protein
MRPDQLCLLTSEKTIQLILALAAASGLFTDQTKILSRHHSQTLLLIICLGITSNELILFTELGYSKKLSKTILNEGKKAGAESNENWLNVGLV